MADRALELFLGELPEQWRPAISQIATIWGDAARNEAPEDEEQSANVALLAAIHSVYRMMSSGIQIESLVLPALERRYGARFPVPGGGFGTDRLNDAGHLLRELREILREQL
ncbi:MAG TPA: hypothetical protein VNF75_00025, partial [Candidatus Dormibacteraeota bacterium]|nr:hypothetical protein [Candidatus Dormibacteraeota bacterium]